MHSITYICLKLSLPKSQIDAAAVAALLLMLLRCWCCCSCCGELTAAQDVATLAWSGLLQLLPAMYIIFIYNKSASLVLVGSSHKRQKCRQIFIVDADFSFLFFWAIGWFLFIIYIYIYVEHRVNYMQRVKMKREFSFGFFFIWWQYFFFVCCLFNCVMLFVVVLLHLFCCCWKLHFVLL